MQNFGECENAKFDQIRKETGVFVSLGLSLESTDCWLSRNIHDFWPTVCHNHFLVETLLPLADREFWSGAQTGQFNLWGPAIWQLFAPKCVSLKQSSGSWGEQPVDLLYQKVCGWNTEKKKKMIVSRTDRTETETSTTVKQANWASGCRWAGVKLCLWVPPRQSESFLPDLLTSRRNRSW